MKYTDRLAHDSSEGFALSLRGGNPPHSGIQKLECLDIVSL
jgi:hypothetical protein